MLSSGFFCRSTSEIVPIQCYGPINAGFAAYMYSGYVDWQGLWRKKSVKNAFSVGIFAANWQNLWNKRAVKRILIYLIRCR